jgi:hypothetical protein
MIAGWEGQGGNISDCADGRAVVYFGHMTGFS